MYDKFSWSTLDSFIKEHPEVDAEKLLIEKLAEIRNINSSSTKNKASLFKSEPELKQWFEQNIIHDFDIKKEVVGMYGDKNVKIDYMLRPRKHLLENGFVRGTIGVEVKYFDVTKGFTKKSSRAIWQTVTYSKSQFLSDDKKVYYTPAYCILFSNLSFKDERKLLQKYMPTVAENDEMIWNGMLHLANHAGVGTLEISGNRKYYNGWAIRSVGSLYFRAHFYNQSKRYELSNPNTINKERYGNF